jgi:hypothetical protein
MYVAPMPWDYATKTAVLIQPWPHPIVRKINQRVRDLRNLVPALSPYISDQLDPADLKALIRGLESAEKAEARRAFPKMQWQYDLIRHTQLRRYLAWERQLLAQIETPLEIEAAE